MLAISAALAASLAPHDAHAAPAVERLTSSQLAGQRIVVGFPGRRPPPYLVRRIRSGRIAGVILFSYNVGSRKATRRLIRRLQSIPRPRHLRDPLLIMIDQEGGRVKRLSGPPTIGAPQMGRAGAPTCRRQGRATGRSLAGVGVNVNLAPVLDVARPGSAMERERRAFGRSVSRVASCGDAFASGLGRRGVAATGKHFPGIGAARRNTDFAVERIRLSKRRLRRFDQAPYRRFDRGPARPRMVMISSAIYPAFSNRPAAFTRSIATRELRRRLGFRGVSITDALNTASVRPYGGPGKVARRVVRAGTDLLLFTDLRDSAVAAKTLKRRLGKSRRSRQRFETSAKRVLRLRAQLRRRG